MALYQGVTGKISVKKPSGTAQYLVHMTTWSVDMTKNIDEAAYFGGSESEEGFTEKTPGVKSWTATADGAADFGSSSGQKELMDAYLEDTLITGTFYLDADTGLQGDGYIESLTIRDQLVQYPNRFKINDTAGQIIEPDFGTVSDQGTDVNRTLITMLLATMGETAGTASSLTLAQPGFALFDGVCVRLKLHTDTGCSAHAKCRRN